MNRYEERAEQTRRAGLRSSMNVWTAGLALIAVALLILHLTGRAPSEFVRRAAIGLALVLLVLRLLSRRLRRHSSAAQPDPHSRIKLD